MILGTPVWAGAMQRRDAGLLKAHGRKLPQAAYVITRSSKNKYEEVYRQMDLYVPAGHAAAVSLRSGDVGSAFWQEEFLRQVREVLAAER